MQVSKLHNIQLGQLIKALRSWR